jgi:hypothetical protein
MFSMAVPAFRRCELHHAVKVYKENETHCINCNRSSLNTEENSAQAVTCVNLQDILRNVNYESSYA